MNEDFLQSSPPKDCLLARLKKFRRFSSQKCSHLEAPAQKAQHLKKTINFGADKKASTKGSKESIRGKQFTVLTSE